MPLKTIYIARHGTLSWETQTWTSPTGVPRDPPLSAHGVDQAKELGLFFKEELEQSEGGFEKEKTMLFSSPLYRCVQTARPTSEALDLPVHIENGLGEWYLPVRKGLHPALSTSAFLAPFFPPSLLAPPSPKGEPTWMPLLTPPRTGESMRSVHLRAKRFLNAFVAELDQRGIERVIVFSHAATCIALSRALAGDLDDLYENDGSIDGAPEPAWNEDERLACRAATCSVSKFDRVGTRESGGEQDQVLGKGKWDRVWNGKTDQLKGGEERHWEFSYVEEYTEDGLLDDGTEAGQTSSDNYKGLPNGGKAVPTSTVEGRL
ncbi:hypothetical protein JCM10212_003098 [Sporobolomyces blumeae]